MLNELTAGWAAWQRWLVVVLAAGLALAGNMVALPLFPGVDLIFGSVIALIVMCTLGWLPALIVGAAAASYTFALWGHGYAIIIFTAEIACVAWWSRCGRKNFLVADFIFWITIGMPLVLLFYAYFLQLPMYAVLLIATKQAVNGLLNVFLAGMIVFLCRFLRGSVSPIARSQEVSFALFLTVFGLVLVSGSVPILMKGMTAINRQEQAYAILLRERLVWVQGLIERSAAEDFSVVSEEIANIYASQSGVSTLLLDESGQSLLGIGEFRLLDGGRDTTQVGMSLWYPTDVQVAMDRWRQGSYFIRHQIPGEKVREIIVGQNAAAAVAAVQAAASRLLGLLAATLLAGMLLAMVLSRWLSVPLQRLTNMVVKSTVAIVTTDMQGSITWNNPAYLDLQQRCGFALENNWVRQLVDATVARQDQAGEHLLHGEHGEAIWLHAACTPIVTPSGRQQGWMLVLNDLTAIKLAERQAKDANLFQQLIIESVPDYLFVKDDSYKIFLANGHFIGLYPAEMRNNIIGSTTLEAYEPDEREAFLVEDRKAFREGYSEIEETITFPDGEVRTLFTKKIRFENNDGKQFILGLARDITDMKAAQEDLFRANQELELSIERANAFAEEANRSNAAKSEFLANMSHEIRTPMNGIVGMNSLLLQTELDAVQQEYAQTIEASAESLLVLINDILDISKIESGKITLEEIEFDLSALVHDLSVGVAVNAWEKRLEYVVDVDPALPGRLLGDPGRLQQVLLNLVSNAIKFTEEGSVKLQVNVSPQAASQATSHESLQKVPSAILIEFIVEDTGIGIDSKDIDRLFEKFTQVDASITRRFGGTGLGLAISQSLVALMGGTLEVTSVVHEGSRFSFALQLPVVSRRPATQSILDPHAIEVIVVDNNPQSVAVLQRQLTSWQLDFQVFDGWWSAQQALTGVREKMSVRGLFNAPRAKKIPRNIG